MVERRKRRWGGAVLSAGLLAFLAGCGAEESPKAGDSGTPAKAGDPDHPEGDPDHPEGE